jgi:hypothetical protein
MIHVRFIVHYTSCKSHEEIRQISVDYFLSISIIVDFRCGTFDNESVHKCLDASCLIFFPHVAKLEVFGQILTRTPADLNTCRQVDLVHTDERTDGWQTAVTHLTIDVRL